jgi:hypothetical protein
MSSKQVTISARISHEDAEFLSQLEINGAKTPSDRLRAIISEHRRRSGMKLDYPGSLQMISEMILPKNQEIRKKELEHQVHSEVITRLAEWLPDAMAFFISAVPQTNTKDDQQILNDLELGLVERLFRLIESFLQLAVSSRCPCYQPDVIKERLTPVLDLCDIISSRLPEKKGE